MMHWTMLTAGEHDDALAMVIIMTDEVTSHGSLPAWGRAHNDAAAVLARGGENARVPRRRMHGAPPRWFWSRHVHAGAEFYLYNCDVQLRPHDQSAATRPQLPLCCRVPPTSAASGPCREHIYTPPRAPTRKEHAFRCTMTHCAKEKSSWAGLVAADCAVSVSAAAALLLPPATAAPNTAVLKAMVIDANAPDASQLGCTGRCSCPADDATCSSSAVVVPDAALTWPHERGPAAELDTSPCWAAAAEA